MSSKPSSTSRPIPVDATPSPDSYFHIPVSPSEPGKFDFYRYVKNKWIIDQIDSFFFRVHLANQTHRKDSLLTETSDGKFVVIQWRHSNDKMCEGLFEIIDVFSFSFSFSAPSLSSGSSSSIPTRRWTPFADAVPTDISKSSSFPSNSRTTTTESTGSFSTLTEIVKNAMNRGHFDSNNNATRTQVCGTTISSKDLNHLCPQSA